METQNQPIQNTLSTQTTGLPAEIVAELDKMARKYGLRYSKLETDYKNILARPDVASRSAADQKRYAFLMLSAECSRYADNPLIDYELMVYGISCNENWGNSKIIAGTMIPGKDVPDLFNGGKMGIETLITNFKDNYKIVEKLQQFAFYRANLTGSQVGAERREITSTIDSEFTPINHPEITQEQIRAWLDKKYPIYTLAQCKTNLSKLIQPAKAGSKPFPDSLDLRRVIVSLKNTTLGTNQTNHSEFAQYTVIDDSLTDEEKLNVKDAAGKTILYGGVAMSIPVFMYKQLNLAENSVVEALVTVRKVKPKEGETTTKAKSGIALDAVAIFPIVDLKKKQPQAQTPSRQTQGVQAVDLAAM